MCKQILGLCHHVVQRGSTWPERDNLAKNDHRIMAELVQARARASEAQAANEAALAPLGLDNGVVLPLRRQSYLERLAAQYRHSQRLYYV